jgi:CheY-like chemotaxis protein
VDLQSDRAQTGTGPSTGRRKTFLFVDDNAEFLQGLSELLAERSKGRWTIATADNHSRALAILARSPVNMVVLDIGMPVVDGVELLRLLRRVHPNQQVSMLTSRASDAVRKTCTDLGAVMFLEKPMTPGDYDTIFSALDALTDAPTSNGFSGVMRRVGLHEVLQLECLGKKSSLLEIFTGQSRGRIFIEDGQVVHAECGPLRGEVALYSILAWRDGEFNLLGLDTPPTLRTISGHWEFLLMEAARLQDEQAETATNETSSDGTEPAGGKEPEPEPMAASPVTTNTAIAEVLLCSGAGEVLHDHGSRNPAVRVRLLAAIETQGNQIAGALGAGRFERLELRGPQERVLSVIRPHLRLLVRSTKIASAADLP